MMKQPMGKERELGALVGELSALVEEVRTRAQRARNERAYVRYLGMLIPIYGTLLKALLAASGHDVQPEQVEQAMLNLLQEMRRVQVEPAP